MGEAKKVVQRKVKQAVAEALIRSAADLLDHWQELHENLGKEVPCTTQEARDIMVPWLLKLPGGSWDKRLGEEDIDA